MLGQRETEGSDLLSATSRDRRRSRGLAGPFRRDIPLDADISRMLPGLRHVVCELHAEKVVHVGAEGFFEA